MFRALNSFKHTILAILFLALWAGNALVWRDPIMGATLAAVYIGMFGSLIGGALEPQEHPAIRTATGSWILLSGIALLGSGAYYLARLDAMVVYGGILLSAPVILWIARHKPARGWFTRAHDVLEEKRHVPPAAIWASAAVILLCIAAVLDRLQASATFAALRTPWDAVSPGVFIAFALAAGLFAAMLMRGKERALLIPLACALLFTFISVVTLVFPLGYGFDPFIHRATESHLALEGTITPKPFYYIGQYALVLFLHHGFAVSIETADAWLVPILATLLLPIAWYAAAVHLAPNRRAATFALAGLFLIPLSSFITTTPQGLANLWTLLLILTAVPFLAQLERPHVWPLALPALATLAIHPIAGIPAGLFLALLASEPRRASARLKPFASVMYWAVALIGSVILPASFVVNSLISSAKLDFDLSALSPASAISALHLDLFFENRFDPLLDFVYLFGFNVIGCIIALAVFGWWFERKALAKHLRPYALLVAMLAVNFVILSTSFQFTFLIDYERQDYAGRLVPIAAFFLAPFVMLGLSRIAERLQGSPVVLRIGVVLLTAAIVTSAFYLTYPRRDAYETSHGFNVSQADLNAVRAIHTDAAGASYIVLSNQSVAAGAIRESGFAHYFGPHYFYPIPTGGELYERFLLMNETPNRDIAQDAATLMNDACKADPSCDEPKASTVYYVVNDYWWQADRLVETGKQTADRWFAIDDGTVYVFRYDLSLLEPTTP